MARLQPVDPESAPDDVRALLAQLPPLNIIRTVARAETCFEPFLRLGTAILTRQQLAADLRELAILRVARLSQAEYEWIQHVPLALDAGVGSEQVDALQRGAIEGPEFDDRERAVLAFTTEVVERVGCSDAVFGRVAAYLSEREIAELTLAIGFYMLVARVMETAQVDLDPPAGPEILERIPFRDA